MVTNALEGSIESGAERVCHVGLALLEPLKHGRHDGRAVLAEGRTETLAEALEHVGTGDDDVDVGVARNALSNRPDVSAQVDVCERRRSREEGVNSLERVEPVLPLRRAEHLKEVGWDLGQDVDRRRYVRLDVEWLDLLRLGASARVAPTAIDELALLRLALLLARRSRRPTRATRSKPFKRLCELGDLDRLEVLEEWRKGRSKKEV